MFHKRQMRVHHVYSKGAVQQPAAESVLREFVSDVDAVGGADGLRAMMDWPDLAVTFEKAVKVLGIQPAERRRKQEAVMR